MVGGESDPETVTGGETAESELSTDEAVASPTEPTGEAQSGPTDTVVTDKASPNEAVTEDTEGDAWVDEVEAPVAPAPESQGQGQGQLPTDEGQWERPPALPPLELDEYGCAKVAADDNPQHCVVESFELAELLIGRPLPRIHAPLLGWGQKISITEGGDGNFLVPGRTVTWRHTDTWWTSDPSLGIDEIGLPVSEQWFIYSQRTPIDTPPGGLGSGLTLGESVRYGVTLDDGSQANVFSRWDTPYVGGALQVSVLWSADGVEHNVRSHGMSDEETLAVVNSIGLG